MAILEQAIVAISPVLCEGAVQMEGSLTSLPPPQLDFDSDDEEGMIAVSGSKYVYCRLLLSAN